MDNCDVYADVDFGRGPVTVRCTEVGEHEQHRCNVIFLEELPQPEEPTINHMNIFEGNADG